MWSRWKSSGIPPCAVRWLRSREDGPTVSDSRRPALSTPGDKSDHGRRGPCGLVLSLAIHLVLRTLFVRIVIVPYDLLTPKVPKAAPLVVERIGFLALPRSTQPQREKPRSGGDNRPPSAVPAPPPVHAPTTVPATIPEPPKQAVPPKD